MDVHVFVFGEFGEFATQRLDGRDVGNLPVGGAVGFGLFVHAVNRLELSKVQWENLRRHVQPFHGNRIFVTRG